jgi:NADP-dependent 3-hydroxy acid dehydrogenase YdfG
MTHVTKVYHQDCYPAISPSSPANSHADRTVLITGASGGIAFATAHAFMEASAAKFILSGRNLDALKATIEKLEAIRPPGSATKLIPYEVDINKLANIEALWKALAKDEIAIDILILNAATPYRGPLLNASEQIWALMETNVLANIRMADKFLAQGPQTGKVSLKSTRIMQFTD